MEKKCRSVSVFLCLCALMLFPSFGDTHSGRLDSSGSHYNRKTGEYHYHRKDSATPPAPSAGQKTPGDRGDESGIRSKTSISITAAEKEKRINDYFRSANENVGTLDCNVVINARNVDDATKNSIKWRNGHKCVICGSTERLEIDHRRALMNGGTNNESNLFTLCDDCHRIKTKLDNSLRRKRESVCRKK